MFTVIRGQSANSIRISSQDEQIAAVVASDAAGLLNAALSRADTNQALKSAKAKAEHFVAELEADIDATAA